MYIVIRGRYAVYTNRSHIIPWLILAYLRTYIKSIGLSGQSVNKWEENDLNRMLIALSGGHNCIIIHCSTGTVKSYLYVMTFHGVIYDM